MFTKVTMDATMKEKVYYQSTLRKLKSVQDKKVSLYTSIQQLEQQERDCISAMTRTECPNPTTQRITFLYCIKQHSPCESLHRQMETIQQRKAQHAYHTYCLVEQEFIVLCASIRRGYLDLVDQVLTDESCNYIDPINGKTALEEAIKHDRNDIAEKVRLLVK